MWYRFYANHGPGHQSSSEFYKWLENGTDEEMQECWEYFFGSYEWPVGGWERVEKLPKDVVRTKLDHYQFQKDLAEKMIAILSKET